MCPDRSHRWRRNRVYEFGSRTAGDDNRLYAQVAEHLLEEAMRQPGEGTMALGQERDLAERFGVSRSTIRNALGLLEKYGLVQRRRGRGTVLTRPAGEGLQVWRLHDKRLLIFQFSPVAVRARDWYGHLLTSVLAAAKSHRQTVEIRYCLTATEIRQELAALGDREQIAGVLLGGAVDPRFVDLCSRNDVPCVCLDYWPHDEFSDAVTVDVETQAFLAARHLAELGHRSVGFAAFGRHVPTRAEIDWDPDVWRFLVHLRRAAHYYRLQMPDEWLVVVQGAQALGRAAGNPLLKLQQLPEAMVCFDAGVARHVLDVLQTRCIKCPRDISVISRGYRPPGGLQFTTLDACADEMGRVAMRLLLERVYRWRSRPLRVAVASRLLEGNSTRSRKPAAR